VSQPFNRGAKVPAPGLVDNSLGEFWVDNPWDISQSGFNLSSYERTRVFLNNRAGNFLDLSYLAGADSDGDGRCVVAGDFRNIGQLDVIVRQAGGGPLLVYENHFPKRHYLKVSLRGRKSNRLGIGARLIAEVNGQPLHRELYPLNSYRSQMPTIIHFGLGQATQVDRLTIRWPSGNVQVHTDLSADKHIVVDEGKRGKAAIETVEPGKTIRP
jgi:hypothetical protein